MDILSFILGQKDAERIGYKMVLISEDGKQVFFTKESDEDDDKKNKNIYYKRFDGKKYKYGHIRNEEIFDVDKDDSVYAKMDYFNGNDPKELLRAVRDPNFQRIDRIESNRPKHELIVDGERNLVQIQLVDGKQTAYILDPNDDDFDEKSEFYEESHWIPHKISFPKSGHTCM